MPDTPEMPVMTDTTEAGSVPTASPDPDPGAAAAPSLPGAPRFRFRNLGPIEDAELELGDLTLLVGRNNTGKTYIAYTLYGFLKMWKAMPHAAEVLARAGRPEPAAGGGRRRAKPAPEPLRAFSRAATEGSARWSVSVEELERHRHSVLSAFASEFSRGRLPSVFNAAPSSFADSSCECLPANLDRASLAEFPFSGPSIGSWRFRFDGDAMLVERLEPPSEPGPDPTFALARAWSVFLFPELRLDPFALCDERFGISLFYRELDFTKSQLVDVLQNLGNDRVGEETAPYLVIDRAASRYAMPIKDNIDFTRGLPDRIRDRSAFSGDKLHNRIRAMMGAYYRVEGDGSIRLRSQARKANRFDIPLHLASSSARGFSDFYFFLRHTATEHHYLIVDEPESHLDPANQRLLARLLSRLVGSGLRILVTTHSDYLLKELNNLMMLHDIGGRATGNPDVDFYAPEDALDRARVRVHAAGDGRLTPCEIDEYGMNIPLFETEIEKINRASHALNMRVRMRRNRR